MKYISHTELFNAKMQFVCNLQFGPHWAPTGLDNMGNLFHWGGHEESMESAGSHSQTYQANITAIRVEFPLRVRLGLLNCCWGNLQTEQLKMQFEFSYVWYGMSKGTRELLLDPRWAPCIEINLSSSYTNYYCNYEVVIVFFELF